MESKERLTKEGVEGGEGVGRRIRVRLLLIIAPVFTMWEGGCGESGWRVNSGGQGSPYRQHLRPRAPLRTSHLASVEVYTSLHNQLLLLPLTLYPSHPPQIKTSRADCYSKVSADATGIDGDGQKGGGSCGSLGPYKRQMLNHLAGPKLVACGSPGMWGTNVSLETTTKRGWPNICLQATMLKNHCYK